jgi:hypothetical protein
VPQYGASAGFLREKTWKTFFIPLSVKICAIGGESGLPQISQIRADSEGLAKNQDFLNSVVH